MIILGTNTHLYGKQLDRIKALGYKGTHNQFRIICKCYGITDANRKCKALGMDDKVFQYEWCSETGNKKRIRTM